MASWLVIGASAVTILSLGFSAYLLWLLSRAYKSELQYKYKFEKAEAELRDLRPQADRAALPFIRGR